VAVPVLIANEAFALEGAAFGLDPESVAKIETVRKSGKGYACVTPPPDGLGSDFCQLERQHRRG
jgi:hypothetical protein